MNVCGTMPVFENDFFYIVIQDISLYGLMKNTPAYTDKHEVSAQFINIASYKKFKSTFFWLNDKAI